jgi:acyl-coenzyme A synthetase/AMP-(fatty) acid ligase
LNFAHDALTRLPVADRALVAAGADGSRREWKFGEVVDRSSRFAGALVRRGIGRGDAVATLLGNSAEWVFAMTGTWWVGAVAFPCNDQLRAGELASRFELANVRAVVTDERRLGLIESSGFDGELFVLPDESLFEVDIAPPADLDAEDPALLAFTSGTSGEPKLVRHGQRYLNAQVIQAEHWYDARASDLCWCTASTGWSLSSRNAFVAPWLRGATAYVFDGRFDADERLDVLEREGINVLCMAPTEYRAIAARASLRELPALRHAVAAGEALGAGVGDAWRDAAGVEIYDGYGQTETGALIAMPLGRAPKPGALGLPLPGYRLWVEDGELCLDPASIPTMMLGAKPETWHTGDRVHMDDEGYFWFEGRADDVIISSGYRIGPSEVETALASHPAVEEAVAVAAPDQIRGAVVRAVVVLAHGWSASEELVAELQAHVRSVTAPYKYPRIVDFAHSLPRTSTGKLMRAAVRDGLRGD